MMRPGRGTICRIERAATLLPLPLSPTTQSVLPRFRLKLAILHRLVVPKPVSNQVLRFFTSSKHVVIGAGSFIVPSAWL